MQINLSKNNKINSLQQLWQKHKRCLGLLMVLCGAAKFSFADYPSDYIPEYGMNSSYEFHIHFTGPRPSGFKPPYAKIVDNGANKLVKTNSSFNENDNTLIVKGINFNIANLGPNSKSVPDANYGIYIYGSRYYDYGLMIPIQLAIKPTGIRTEWDITSDVDGLGGSSAQFRLYPIGNYKYTLDYPQGISLSVDNQMNEAFNGNTHKSKGYSGCNDSWKCHGATCNNPQKSDLKNMTRRKCEYPQLTTVVTIELPYRNTTFMSPKKSVVKSYEFTNTWNGTPED